MINEMLLGFVTGILNKYIGEYFENIDVSQLTGSLFGGGVTLNNVNLRSTILDSIGLPFHVVLGKCGTLEIRYSLTKLYSEPVQVTLKDVYVLITPTRSITRDENVQHAAKQNLKMRQLEIYESVKHHINQNPEHSKSPEITYFDMWVMQILRNIQFHMESVHIRFEDDITSKTEPFAAGLTLESLEILTTDANWKSQYVKDYMPETIYKFGKVTGLAVYWNPAPTTMFKGIDDQKLLLNRLNVIPKTKDAANKFLFGPLTMELKIQITPFPDATLHPFAKPRLRIETSLNNFNLSLSDHQLRDILLFLDTIDMLITGHKYRNHRLDAPYKGHYKEWWKFAFDCIIDDIERRRNNFRWQNIANHREKCKQYFQARVIQEMLWLTLEQAYYKSKQLKKVTAEVTATLAKLEDELDLFNLILVRKHVDCLFAKREKPEGSSTAETSGTGSWLTSFFSSPKPAPPPPVVPAQRSESIVSNPPALEEVELTRQDKEELKLAVSFVKNIAVLNFPEDYIDFEADALFNEIRIRLYVTTLRKRETILDTLFDKVNISMRLRPVGAGIRLDLKMGSIEAYGGDIPVTPTAAAFETPQIITIANPGTSEYFVRFLYEKAPLDSEVDHRVHLEGLALQFTYDEPTITRLTDFFGASSKKREKKLGNIPATSVLNRILQFKSASTTRLLKLMENKGKVEACVCLVAPYIVIPQDANLKGKSNFFVIHLGEVNLFGTIIGGTVCTNGICTDLRVDAEIKNVLVSSRSLLLQKGLKRVEKLVLVVPFSDILYINAIKAVPKSFSKYNIMEPPSLVALFCFCLVIKLSAGLYTPILVFGTSNLNNGIQVQKQDIPAGSLLSTIFARNSYDVGVARKATSNNSEVCKEPSGQFADPKYCDKYYDCWEGRPVSSGQCSHGLMFNEQTSSCDYPSMVNCQGKEVSEPLQDVDAGCEQPYGTFANPRHCGKYTVCHAGMASYFTCQDGLAYDKDLGVCTQPQDPTCLQHAPHDPPEGEELPEIPLDPDNIQPGRPDGGSEGGGSIGFPVFPGAPPVKCPMFASGFIPIAKDCQSVLVCMNGNGYLLRCPEGNYYHPPEASCKPGRSDACEQTTFPPFIPSTKNSNPNVKYAYTRPEYPLLPTQKK
ncbi:Vacuolar protein sorting-associated protein 13A [Orchesella cincta]|uniref:Vacuolar protein sorting-associated protein 13A n=1 Tax=Orchesella cincta TaxID=48709 RepID=A0A1D2MM31_ORCCI|nr:Vacuolar protein sorting-associated protein 13A [Orchesella cincta]